MSAALNWDPNSVSVLSDVPLSWLNVKDDVLRCRSGVEGAGVSGDGNPPIVPIGDNGAAMNFFMSVFVKLHKPKQTPEQNQHIKLQVLNARMPAIFAEFLLGKNIKRYSMLNNSPFGHAYAPIPIRG